jgi:hypothetical protein
MLNTCLDPYREHVRMVSPMPFTPASPVHGKCLGFTRQADRGCPCTKVGQPSSVAFDMFFVTGDRRLCAVARVATTRYNRATHAFQRVHLCVQFRGGLCCCHCKQGCQSKTLFSSFFYLLNNTKKEGMFVRVFYSYPPYASMIRIRFEGYHLSPH